MSAYARVYNIDSFSVMKNFKTKRFSIVQGSFLAAGIPVYIADLNGFAIFDNYDVACSWARVLNARLQGGK